MALISFIFLLKLKWWVVILIIKYLINGTFFCLAAL